MQLQMKPLPPIRHRSIRPVTLPANETIVDDIQRLTQVNSLRCLIVMRGMLLCMLLGKLEENLIVVCFLIYQSIYAADEHSLIHRYQKMT